MSWETAKKDASAWVKSFKLPTDLKGKIVDLKKRAEDLPYEGEYREMVLRAAARILKQRGAKIIL
jgi:hypothetical protein